MPRFCTINLKSKETSRRTLSQQYYNIERAIEEDMVFPTIKPSAPPQQKTKAEQELMEASRHTQLGPSCFSRK